MDGSILLNRKLLESSVFSSEKRLKIWIWLLLKASYKKRFVTIKIGRGETTIEINRGELLFGRFKAEEALNIDGSTIYKILQKFELDEMIVIKSNSHYTIISICNYDIYQSHEQQKVTANKQPFNSHLTAVEQPLNTYNKDNKVNNNKYIYSEFYDSEISQTENSTYKDFVKFLFGQNVDKKPLYGVLSIKNQLSEKQFELLLAKCNGNKKLIGDIVTKIDNDKKYYKDKTSLYRTVLNWIEGRFLKN